MEFHKILVPVVGTKADEDAIRLACSLAKKNKGKIWAVYVIRVKRVLPLDAEIEPEIKKAEDVLDRMDGVAEEQEYEIDTDLQVTYKVNHKEEALEDGRKREVRGSRATITGR